MVVDKPNVGPEKNRLPAETAPPRQNDPPALKSVKSPGNPLGHEQAVISGMGEEAPAPAGTPVFP